MNAVEQLTARLMAYRLPVGEEEPFQRAIADVLAREGYPAEREYDLGPGRGRIDFYLRSLQVGLELKVKGSPGDVGRQLQRYMTSREITALILVTGRSRLGALPRTLGGKPLYIAAMWRGLL